MDEEKHENTLAVTALVAEFALVLERWPLYREFKYNAKHMERNVEFPGQAVRYAMLPNTLTLLCSNKKCQKIQQWRLYDEQSGTFVYFGHEPIHQRKYFCRNCGENVVYYFFRWSETPEGGVYAKVGQYPPLEEEVADGLRKQLDKDDLEFYQKAVRLRNHAELGRCGVMAVARLEKPASSSNQDAPE